MNSGLSNTQVLGIAINSSGHIFVATYGGGVFRSTNNGDTWTHINSGLTNPRTRVFTFNPTSHIFVGTHGGIFRSVQSTTSVEQIIGELPTTFALQQNYPNPFNPSTTIKYALPQTSHVSLSVYNTLGQRVALLVERKQEAGYHEVNFDASGLTSGVYFYRLQASNPSTSFGSAQDGGLGQQFIETKKLILGK